MAEPLIDLLQEAFDRLRAQPIHHRGVIDALGPVRIALDIAQERVTIQTAGSRIALREGAPSDGTVVEVRSTRHTLHALADGDLHLVDALDDCSLHLRAPPDALDAARDAMSWFLHGAVRTEGFEELLHRLVDP